MDALIQLSVTVIAFCHIAELYQCVHVPEVREQGAAGSSPAGGNHGHDTG
jgi:hypothetical protein